MGVIVKFGRYRWPPPRTGEVSAAGDGVHRTRLSACGGSIGHGTEGPTATDTLIDLAGGIVGGELDLLMSCGRSSPQWSSVRCCGRKYPCVALTGQAGSSRIVPQMHAS